MSGKRYPEEFKIEAVKQVVDHGHSIASVATRLDITTHSLYAWVKKYGPDSSATKTQSDAQCVRWYLAYSLSLRNLEEIMAERGIVVDHSTLHRWLIRLVPRLDKAFRRYKRNPGRRRRMDETYIKIRGQWKYLYRAVDSTGQTIDLLLVAKRDAAAALRFFRKAIRNNGEPEVVTIDKSGANTAALDTLNAGKGDEESIIVRQSRYLNNLIEQEHRNIKRRIRLMLGFKSFRRAQTILAGIELIHMIRKGQYKYPQGERVVTGRTILSFD